ncbi:MAG: YdcF family protein [Desulfovibrionaceae bacterium]
MKRFAGRLLQILGALTLIGVVALAALFFLAPRILVVQDEPARGHAVILLGGAYSRPLYGADLYNKGLAPQVLISNAAPLPIRPRLEELGIHPPTQPDIYYDILVKKGVNGADIGFFGENLATTRDEARALAELYDDEPVTLLVVTSPFHSRRAKVVLENALPRANIVMLPSPYEDFPDDWWRRHRLALRVVMEAVKTVYYASGLDFGYETKADKAEDAAGH